MRQLLVLALLLLGLVSCSQIEDDQSYLYLDQPYNEENNLQLFRLKESNKYACLANPIDIGEDYQYDEYIESFSRGKCDPLVLVPGIFGTSLEIKFKDCKLFKQKHQRVFDKCGWTECESLQDTTHRIWIGGIKDEFSILQRISYSNCLEIFLKSRTHFEGLEYKYSGEQNETQDLNCGKQSVANLSSSRIVNQFCSTSGFSKVQEYLESLGYRIGLTYQVLPYDWREASKNSQEMDQRLKNIINNLNLITGKKVSILAHSYGNLRVLKALNSFSQGYKDSKIAKFISLSAPFLGSPKLLKNIVYKYDNDFNLRGFGLSSDTQRELINALDSLGDLVPQPHLYEYLKNQTLYHQMSEFLEDRTINNTFRELYEKYEAIRQLVDDKFLKNVFQSDLLSIENQSYPITEASMKIYYNKSGAGDIFHEKYIQHRIDPKILSGNPRVETHILFPGYQNTTIYGFSIQPTYNIVGKGDFSVTSSSHIIIPLSWYVEHKLEPKKNKPVKFYSICDSRQITKEDFKTFNCSAKLQHDCQLYDAQLLSNLLSIIKDDDESHITQRNVQARSHQYYQELKIQTCRLIQYNYFKNN